MKKFSKRIMTRLSTLLLLLLTRHTHHTPICPTSSALTKHYLCLWVRRLRRNVVRDSGSPRFGKVQLVRDLGSAWHRAAAATATNGPTSFYPLDMRLEGAQLLRRLPLMGVVMIDVGSPGHIVTWSS
ncbi:hypothetical protein BGW80DRAFT_1314579 [Lactifluus volemus]|nr:hypothetical protein BGW80DRAFT_1314579 [Lactifluus volemus]